MMLYVLKVDNSEKRINYTPLEVAAYRGGLKIFKVLLEGGANLFSSHCCQPLTRIISLCIISNHI